MCVMMTLLSRFPARFEAALKTAKTALPLKIARVGCAHSKAAPTASASPRTQSAW